MKKRVIIICIIVLVAIAGLVLFFNRNKFKATAPKIVNTGEYYGKRGDISETERVSFLTKADDLLVGMMALEPKTEETAFSETDMVKFALYVAQERYSTMLAEKKGAAGENVYLIEPEVVDSIISEIFGRSDIQYSYEETAYNYSRSNKGFLFKVDLAKTLWYYPVSQETTDDRISITVDSVYINDDQQDYALREAKYEGKYKEDKVDSTIKFNYDKNGYLVSYQYVNK